MTASSPSGVFRFAIITDTHIRAPGGDLSSPFPVNTKANDRARFACNLIREQEPAFTIHLGDMVHPLPHMHAYEAAVEEAHSIFRPLKPALYFVPGNHDIGDKPSPAMPAKPATRQSMSRYHDAFGADWHWFEHQGVAFVIINSSLVNSESDRAKEQKVWLEQTLGQHTGRKFLFSHYPPFITHSAEDDHYDNYAEPGRSWLLNLAHRTGVEAIFSGHVHHFFFNRFESMHLHCLPATSFTRQDYAEMFAVSPAAEFGRDDSDKFSIAIVDVQPDSYNLSLIPTSGAMQGPEEAFNAPELKQGETALIPHLRHCWHETRYLPYNGPMEEFSRKVVRNDYPLLRLLQLGIKTVRVPLSDALDLVASARLSDWGALGLSFVVFSIGIPDETALTQIRQRAEICGLEILSARGDLQDITSSLASCANSLHKPLSISKITSSADNPDPGAPYAHSVSAGFLPGEVENILSELGTVKLDRPPGLVVQIPWGQSPAELIPQLVKTAGKNAHPLVVNIRIANPNPAVANYAADEIELVLRQALDTASLYESVSVQCDTFEDIDRGYQPRYGLIDRLSNIRIDCRS